jgi:hypothetical protein
MFGNSYYSPHVSREKFDETLEGAARYGTYARYGSHVSYHVDVTPDKFSDLLREFRGAFHKNKVGRPSTLTVNVTHPIIDDPRIAGSECIHFYSGGVDGSKGGRI